MNIPRTLILVLVVVVGLSMTAPAVLAQSDDGETTTETPEGEEAVTADEEEDSSQDNSSDVAPGQRLSGIVAMQQEEVRGDIEKRVFGLKVAQAASDNERAGVVGDQFKKNNDRLDELREDREALREARENGEISESEYTTRMSKLNGQVENLKGMNNETENASQGLPADVLEANGVNASAIETLKNGADELSGDEVSKVAKSIVGAPDNPGDRGNDKAATARGNGNGNGNGNADDAGEGEEGEDDDERQTPADRPNE